MKPCSAGYFYVCAGHGALLHRRESYDQVFAEPKVRRRARASSRGGVWRKSNPKLRGDEQKPVMRRDASGASGHVTVKPSICGWGAFCGMLNSLNATKPTKLRFLEYERGYPDARAIARIDPNIKLLSGWRYQ